MIDWGFIRFCSGINYINLMGIIFLLKYKFIFLKNCDIKDFKVNLLNFVFLELRKKMVF